MRDDYGKLFFSILDYTGSATRLFADPDFDGEPARITEEEMAADGAVVPGTESITEYPPGDIDETRATTSSPTTPRASAGSTTSIPAR